MRGIEPVIVMRWVADSRIRRLIAKPIFDDHIVPVHALLPVSVIGLL
jgi:hypothetical protein